MTRNPFNFLANEQKSCPVWFMRQAGRYHHHYRQIRSQHSFMEMCKTPKLACDITMGPIQDFNFNAAILFSDLLFPLEHLGLGLDYDSGPPRIHHPLSDAASFKLLKEIMPAKNYYQFQHDACKLLKSALPKDKTLLGFVGGPWTLFTYASEGKHDGQLHHAKLCLHEKLFAQFCEVLFPSLMESLLAQAHGGADALCLFDTAAGELCPSDYKNFVVPELTKIFKSFKEKFPHKGLIYYSKLTTLDHLKTLPFDLIDVLGIDWRLELTEVLKILPAHVKVQGNFDPSWLHFPMPIFKECLAQYVQGLKDKHFPFHRWIAGLGHGVTVGTPEEQVRYAVNYLQAITSNLNCS